MESSFNFKDYRDNLANTLKEKRKENKDEALIYLEEIRNTNDYKEAERLYRESFALARLEEDLNGDKIESFQEAVPVKHLIEKYNIGEISEKLSRQEIEEKLEKAETREEKYKILEDQCSNTPLLELKNLLPNNNNLFVKLESENALGNSHYMRVYLELIRHYEETGDIKPGQKLYDFTSGTSGIAMAAVGTLLGYQCEVGIPAGGEKAREKAILDWIPQEQLHFSDEKKYVDGAKSFNQRFLAKNRDIFFLNHAMAIGPNKEYVVNEISTNACSRAVDEIKKSIEKIDKFVAISGNGTTQYGYGRRLKELYPSIEIIGAESFQSALVFNKLYPGEYKQKYGIDPDERDKFSRHRLPGTSFPTSLSYPALEASLSILSDEKLVWDEKAANEYQTITGLKVPNDAIFFDKSVPEELQSFGRTTKVGYNVAKELAEKTNDQNYLIFAYDNANRYDS